MTIPSTDIIALHRAELFRVLRLVRCETQARPLRRFPTRYSVGLFNHLNGGAQEPQGIGHCIRQIHDFYGWMAKHGRERGTCAGSLYRTCGYMSIPLADRDGTQGKKRNVHIEHTVPVNDLKKILCNRLPQPKTAADLHRCLIAHSVCVAFSNEEENLMVSAKVPRSRNDAFDQNGKRQCVYPFKRYLPLQNVTPTSGIPFQIINVLEEKPVDLNRFTFQDHENLLRCASKAAAGVDYLYDLEAFCKFD